MKRNLMLLPVLLCSLAVAQSPTSMQVRSGLFESDAIDVIYSGMCGEQLDAISIHRAGVSTDSISVVESRYTGAQRSGTLRFGPLDAGTYEVRARCYETTDVRARALLQVQAGRPARTQQSTARLRLASGSVTLGKDIIIDFDGFTEDTSNVIVIAKKGDDDRDYFARAYTTGLPRGRVTIAGVHIEKPGEYEVRAKFGDQIRLVQARVPLTVTSKAGTPAPGTPGVKGLSVTDLRVIALDRFTDQPKVACPAAHEFMRRPGIQSNTGYQAIRETVVPYCTRHGFTAQSPTGGGKVAAAPPLKAPPVGRYTCLRLLPASGNTVADDVHLLPGGRYTVAGATGAYTYDAQTARLTWSSGAFATAKTNWVGVFEAPKIIGDQVTIRIRSLADVKAGNKRDLQWCNAVK